MDCRKFDGQVVRLEEIKSLAEQFVLVRLGNIDNLDLNLFRFDYDLTFMVFFLNAQDKVYARYGQRDATGPDGLQSLKGLQSTMRSVLATHAGADRAFAPRDDMHSTTVRNIAGRGRRCFHCHQVNEAVDRRLRDAGKWDRDTVYRYPMPDRLGLFLEVDQGNVVRRVDPGAPGAALGLKKGDLLQTVGAVPIHSIADVQFALDRAPRKGEIELKWKRDGKTNSGMLALPEGWRRGDVSWRPSLRRMVPSLPLRGTELSAGEKKTLGLEPGQVAFRQRSPVSAQAEKAGVRAGDVITGIDGKPLRGTDVDALRDHVRRQYLVGDRIQINVLRDGKRLDVPLTLR
jgi:predicted metalloprotease with PDZ domain